MWTPGPEVVTGIIAEQRAGELQKITDLAKLREVGE